MNIKVSGVGPRIFLAGFFLLVGLVSTIKSASAQTADDGLILITGPRGLFSAPKASDVSLDPDLGLDSEEIEEILASLSLAHLPTKPVDTANLVRELGFNRTLLLATRNGIRKVAYSPIAERGLGLQVFTITPGNSALNHTTMTEVRVGTPSPEFGVPENQQGVIELLEAERLDDALVLAETLYSRSSNFKNSPELTTLAMAIRALPVGRRPEHWIVRLDYAAQNMGDAESAYDLSVTGPENYRMFYKQMAANLGHTQSQYEMGVWAFERNNKTWDQTVDGYIRQAATNGHSGAVAMLAEQNKRMAVLNAKRAEEAKAQREADAKKRKEWAALVEKHGDIPNRQALFRAFHQNLARGVKVNDASWVSYWGTKPGAITHCDEEWCYFLMGVTKFRYVLVDPIKCTPRGGTTAFCDFGIRPDVEAPAAGGWRQSILDGAGGLAVGQISASLYIDAEKDRWVLRPGFSISQR